MWWHLAYDTLVTSEWDTPDMFENGLMPELLLAGKYGHKLHFWDLHRRKHLQEIDFGAQHQLIFELRPAHDPTKAYGFVNCVLSLSPWLTLVGLGMYHGVNPAMGWLFAAALGLHRGRRVVVMQSLVPIAIGHLLSIAATVEIALVLGIIIDRRRLLMVAGGGLILWALYHLRMALATRRASACRPGSPAFSCGPSLWRAPTALGSCWSRRCFRCAFFGRRDEWRDRCGRDNHPARCGLRPHGGHGNRQRDHRDSSVRLDRARLPAARVDKL
jgi:hypothetical protein